MGRPTGVAAGSGGPGSAAVSYSASGNRPPLSVDHRRRASVLLSLLGDDMSSAVDHLVLAGGDLGHLIDWFAERSGVRPAPGGSHPGAGTRNALVALDVEEGEHPRYLELIGPDPDQPSPAGLRPFGIDGLGPTDVKLAMVAVAVDDIDAAVGRLAATEAVPGDVRAMSRTRPDGVELSWRLAIPTEERQQGVVPFLIEWGTGTPHPGAGSGAGTGCTLTALNLQHPEPELIERALEALELDDAGRALVDINAGQPAVISATLNTPAGVLQL